ncbi:ABC transporter ATP-binding protein [Bacillus sp. IITD106]|nr:ABC transporter ATP-binding protein [Bacillus sp. IITD106]
MQTILEVYKLTKKFGNVVANHDINMKVKQGTIHSIIGENGAGKSTLMNMIAGLLEPTSGDIFIRGEKVQFKNANHAYRSGIGMVHQEFMLFPELTVLENITMGRERTKQKLFLDKQQARREIQQICDQYHFKLPLDSLIKDLPVSIRQQVEIIKVLYRGADIIILDEPTAVLTPQGIDGLFTAIKFLVSMGKTIIFITHKLKEVLKISDTITVLKNGQVTGMVHPSDVNEEKLANMMVGREVLLKVNKPKKELGRTLCSISNFWVKGDDQIDKAKDINFSIKQGEIIGIAGVAGNGQRELVDALLGIRKPSKGTFTFNRQDITKLGPREKRLLGIGYISDDRLEKGSNVEAAVWENAIMGYHIAHGFKSKIWLDKKQAFNFTNKIIKDFNVKTPSIHSQIKTLSGGNIQKLIVGREFSQKNSLLIIEDPTRGIDIGAIEFIWNRIIEIAKNGVSILLISHELNEVLSLSDRILVFYDGYIAGEVHADEATEQEIGLLMTGGKQQPYEADIS